MPAEPAGRHHPVLLAQHQLHRHRGLRQLQQPGLQQRLDQQLEIGRAVRGVLDDAGQLALADPARRGAQRQRRQPPAQRQLQDALAEQPGQQQQRHAPDELADHLELDRAPAGPAAGGADAGDAARPAAPLEFKGHPAAQRVAHQMGAVPAEPVELTFDVVGQHRRAEQPGARVRSAVVAGHGRGEDRVTAGFGQPRRHRIPHRLRHQEPVQQHDRLPGTILGAEVDGRTSRHTATLNAVPPVPQVWWAARAAVRAGRGTARETRREKIGAS